MGRPVARYADPDMPHCSGMVRAKGSENVITNGRPTERYAVDPNTPHLKPGGKKCVGHKAPIFKGGPTVFVNALPIGHKIDPTCTAVAKGSETVIAN